MSEGWIDLQVNGYLGVDFSSPELTESGIAKVVEGLADRGVSAFCPTIITSDPAIYRRNLPLLGRACRSSSLGPYLLGIHLEGPFLSPLPGARGAHKSKWMTHPRAELFDQYQEWAEEEIVLVTLAPELPGAVDFIGHLSEQGITTSLGHHLAGLEQIEAAVKAGARGVTHLGNGIPNELPRHPNPLWDQLAVEDLTVMLITDGHHLPPSFIRVALRSKGLEKIVIVSDAAPIAGYPPGDYDTLGQRVRLEESGKLWNPEGDHLVGSSANLSECVEFLRTITDLSPGQLRQVARGNPLALLGLDHEC